MGGTSASAFFFFTFGGVVRSWGSGGGIYGDAGGDLEAEDIESGEGDDRGDGVFRADLWTMGLLELRVFQNFAIRDL